MSKTIEAVYENGIFRPLDPVSLTEGLHVQVSIPESEAEIVTRVAALDTFDSACEDLTEEQLQLLDEAIKRSPWFGNRQLDL
jgi:predicted DNA-binding antitoxin AbrB/MazE fold protein